MNDPRYESFKKLNERKQVWCAYAQCLISWYISKNVLLLFQVFNAYKTQKQKDEKEEQRIRAKRSKEQLEEFLLHSEKMSSTTKYYKCEELFGHLEVWQNVNDSDRRDIYEDAVFALAKREKEEGKTMKKRNMKRLAEVLECMTKVNYDTTWTEAQVSANQVILEQILRSFNARLCCWKMQTLRMT